MGKAVPKGIKRKAEYLLKAYPEKFSKDFEKNKQTLKDLELPLSNQSRNWVAGFITRYLGGQESS